MSTTRSIAPRAPATDGALDDVALLICAHGVHGGVGVAARHADDLRRRRVVAEVASCCLKGRPHIGQALAELSADRIVVVPMLMAAGHTMQALLPALQACGAHPGRVVLARPVGLHAGLAAVIHRRGARLCRSRGWPTEQTALVLVAHGTSRNADSAEAAYRHAAAIRDAGAFADVVVAFLANSPRVPDALVQAGRNAIVIGLFADRGVHMERDIPFLLAPFGGSVIYDGPVGAAPELSDLLLAQATAAMADRPPAAA
jgi:sirohydrochlorin cobaltochelatase